MHTAEHHRSLLSLTPKRTFTPSLATIRTGRNRPTSPNASTHSRPTPHSLA